MKIDVKFLFFDNEVCGRCKTTEEALITAVERLKRKHKDIQIKIERQKLPEEELENSPTILLDGKDLESYLTTNFEQKSDYCANCSCLVSRVASCRTYDNHKNLSVAQMLTALERHTASQKIALSCNCFK